MLKTFLLLLPAFIFAQSQYTVPFRSAQNQYYWKNNKPYEGYWQQDVKYEIKAQVDDIENTVEATEYTLTYYNNSPNALTELFFHLNENAFQPDSYYDNLWKNNKLKPKFGKSEAQKLGTTTKNWKVNGKEVKTQLDNTILKVFLNEQLQSQDSIVITCSFKTYWDTGSMRRRNKTFVSNGIKHFDGVHWYPIICVYDKKFGWHTDQHLDKEFYANFGSFDVELTFPQEYIVEATGVLMNEANVMPDSLKQKLDFKRFLGNAATEKPSVIIPKEVGKTKTWKYYAVNVHNFAFTADPLYRIDKVSFNGIDVIALVQEPNIKKWLPSANFTREVMRVYSNDFGTYIWPKIIVADAQDGMEYPMLTLDGGAYPQHQGLLAHEVGHMWFYGMLGSNETYRASLDEGFTQFATIWSLDKIVGKKRQRGATSNYIKKRQDSITTRFESLYNPYLQDVHTGYDEQLNTHSSGFHGAIRQGGSYRLVYHKTGVMLYNLKYVLGDSLFLKAMQHYVKKWTGKHPYPEDFRDAITEYTQTDLTWFFDQWLETTKFIDYQIVDVKKLNKSDSLFSYKIKFRRRGRMQMPIDFTLTTSKGKFDYYIPNTWFEKKTNATVLPKWYGWDKLQPTYEAIVTVSGKIKNVQIDPKNELADMNLLDNATKYESFEKNQFENYVLNPQDWTKKRNYFRPDIWWNRFDGLQLGLNYHGEYFNKFYEENYYIWFNTRLLQDVPLAQQKNNHRISWYTLNRFNLSTYLWKQLYVFQETQHNAGLFRTQFGFEKFFKAQDLRNPRGTKLFINHLAQYRSKITESPYLLYPTAWEIEKWNTAINFGIKRNYPFLNGIGEWTAEMRTPGIGNQFNYSYLQFNTTNNFNAGKLEFRTRIFARYGMGNTPKESALYLANASPEEQFSNRLYRASGIIPQNWTGYGADINHFQPAGGLNIRGFAGYLAPQIFEGNTINNYIGRSGASINIEMDFDKIFPIKAGKTSKYVHLDTYLFYDIGLLSVDKINDNQALGNVRMSAGPGTALTIKFGDLNIKPLVIRADFPVFVNQYPTGKQAWEFRYVLGINRSF
ncbi:MAG: M1 family peptidase [Bacteroidetes bacterium]|nr:MAG: M1 family peptidase [Bacteroidota bacterium]